MKRYALGIAALAAVACSTARADLIVNGGLAPATTNPTAPHLVYASTTVNSSALTGWSITAGTIDVVPSTYWQSPAGTSWSVDLIGTPNGPGINAPGIGQIRQTVATATGENYRLAFDFSINPETFPGAPSELNTLKRLLVQVRDAQGDLLATDLLEFTRGTRTLQDMQWTTRTLDFTADGASTITFTAVAPGFLTGDMTLTGLFAGPVVGNISLDVIGSANPVPEPASLAVLGIGGMMLLRRRRP